jgi:hypothetical protein
VTGFPTLHDFVWPAPLPALSALALTAGLLGAGRRLAERVFGVRAGPLEVAAGFVGACAGTAAAAHGLAWAGLALRWGCAALGAGLAALGLLELRRAPAALRALREALSGGGLVDRLMLAAAFAAFAGCLAGALGPACEQDVLAYHLGVPVDWFREGRAAARPDWMHARLAGLGEALNLLGLACGTDALGAVLQCAGVGAAAVALGASAPDAAGRRLAVVLVAACPLVLGLGAIAKPQMLPSAALAVAVALCMKEGEGRGARLVLAAAAAAFAVASKHSYLLAALPVAVLWARAAAPLPRRGPAIGLAVAAVLAVAAPHFLRNALWHGDPLSPLLERWSAAPDGEVVEFARYLREWGSDGPHPALAVLAPVGGTPMLQTFGICAILALAGLAARGPWRRVAAAGALQALLVVALGQPRPRFFLDPWLLLSMAWISSRAGPLPALPRFGLALQGAAAAALSIVLGALTGTGAIAPPLRESVVQRYAWRAAACRWIDETIPADARVVTSMNCAAFFPRPHRHWGETAPESPERAKDWRPPPLHRGFGATHFVADDDATRSAVEADMAYDGAVRADLWFESVGRNPFRRAGRDRITVWTYAGR